MLNPDHRIRSLLLAFGWVFLPLHHSLAATLADAALPVIDGARVSEAIGELRIHGIPTRIRHIEVDSPLAQVSTHYRSVLGRQHVETHIDGWHVLSRRAGQVLQTVRLRPLSPDVTEGTLSESDLAAASNVADRPLGIRLPAGSHLTSDVEAITQGRHSRLLTWHGSMSLAQAVQHLRKELDERGYRFERELPVDDQGLRGSSLWFAAERREALATITEHAARVTVTLSLIGTLAQEGE
ncbi:MAG TPA: hypothetical protein PL024_04720 [Thauera sp.]|jgi:hypothetical protein|nr:hypothetical protein [Thauera sp.]